MTLLRMKKVMCTSCPTSFRLPEDDLKNGRVQCPSCGHDLGNNMVVSDQHRVSHNGKRSEQKAQSSLRKRVAFRCAKHGMKFSAWFVSKGATNAHVLDEIERHDEPPSILALFRAPMRGPRQPETHDDIGNFDFTGWACPYCQHGYDGPGGAFFACSCGELVCGGRSRRTLLGATIYRCHDGCGVEGRASGTIDRVVTQSAAQARLRVSAGKQSQALPARSARKLLPRK